MAASLTTLRIALIIIIIVAILVVIHASWTLNTINSTVGDECACSGVSDSQLSGLRTYTIIALLLAIGVAIYAVVMLLIPTAEARREAGSRYRERFNRKTL